MRGRDIKRYSYEFADLYLISTFPSLKIDIEIYPAVKQHLLSFGYDRIKQTGDKGSRKKTNNQWFETQDSISYWEDFSKQKIIYPDIMRMPRQKENLEHYPYLYLDDKNYYVEATNFMMTGLDIDLVYSFIISDLGFFIFSKFYAGPQFDSTGFRYKKAYLEEMFIPKFSDNQKNEVRKLMNIKEDTKTVIKGISDILHTILDLNSEEIRFVENYKLDLLTNSFNE